MKEKREKNGRVTKITNLFGSSLPGKVPAVDLSALRVGVAERIAGLDPLVQATVQEMSLIMAGHPIRPWVTADGSRASVHYPAVVRAQSPKVLARFQALFFGIHHAEICELFAAEFAAAARTYEGRAKGVDARWVGWDVEEEG